MSTSQSPKPGKEHDLSNPIDLVFEKITELEADRSFVRMHEKMREYVHHNFLNGIFKDLGLKLLMANEDFPFPEVCKDQVEINRFLLAMYCLELEQFCQSRLHPGRTGIYF